MGKQKKSVSQKDASRVQSGYAKKHGGKVPAGSFPARLTRSVGKNQSAKS